MKLLDFGLAKAFTTQREVPAATGENSPTLTIGATEVGMILGTAAYMSPEQARGKNVDKRADIWSFGVVLYELLSGERLFKGEDATETLARVVTAEPDLNKVPPQARGLIEACLHKDVKLRLKDIGDAKRLLSRDSDGAGTAGASSSAIPAPLLSRLGLNAWIIAALLVIAAVAGWAVAYRATRPAELKPLVRLDVDLGSDVSLTDPNGAAVILSPDGTRLVFVSKRKLFTRKLDQPQAVELAGTDGAFGPFFSPGGQWVAFFAQQKLKKISVEGGTAIALCDAADLRGGSCGEDGNIIAALGTFNPLMSIPSAGGSPTPVTQLAQGEAAHRWPQILPGGKAVLFTSATGNSSDMANIEVMTLADHRRKTLITGGTFGRYLATASKGSGHLLYVNRGTLFAVPFDLDKLEARAALFPVESPEAQQSQSHVIFLENFFDELRRKVPVK